MMPEYNLRHAKMRMNAADCAAMHAWYQSTPGTWLLDLERAQIASVLARTRGHHLMQVGGTNDLRHSADSLIHHRFRLALQSVNIHHDAQVCARWDELPLLPQSLDVALLIHVLEFVEQPSQLLKQIYHSLTPGGQLVIVGFNPWSYWGLAKLLQRQKIQPWSGKFWSCAQIKRWLWECEYSVIVNKTFCFRSPRGKARGRQFTLFSEVLGQLCLPTLGGVYLIAARKKIYEPLWQRTLTWKKRVMVPKLVEPTTRL